MGQLQIIGSRILQTFGAGLVPRGRKELQSVDSSRGWFPLIREPFSGAWQRNQEETVDSVLSYGPVFACQTLIASDVAKCRPRLVEQDANGIWNEVERASPFWPVLRKPNHYQNRIQFFENWMLSKLSWGNTYVLKARDARGVVVALYILDPQRVKPLVSDAGEVFYRISKDPLSRQTADDVTVPAREIIHDRFNCFFHPLVGLSPLFAATLPASVGLKIQRNASKFFQNAARPSGILTAPGDISKETADGLKAYWETNFSGDNTAKIAVLGDGLKYEPMTMTSVDAQLVEQLGISGKQVCAVYHVPPYKAGVTDPPSYNNIEALEQAYYSQCLQRHIEDAELCLDEGLALTEVQGKTIGVEFDLDDLLRMDSATQIKSEGEAVKSGIKAPNEARRKLNLAPTPGGEGPYLQQQNFSLSALAKRDAQEDPFGTAKPADPPPAANDEEEERRAAAFVGEFRKSLTEALDAA
jgi:HK97 family phage portal protein